MRSHATTALAWPSWARHALACVLAAAAALPAAAADHVLVITLSEYAPTATVGALKGVLVDRQNALEIARRLGLNPAAAVLLHDAQATLAGIRQALAQLEQTVAANDRVFIYYSGHGASKRVADVCQSTLVTYEDDDLLSSEFYGFIARIKARVPRQLLVMLDACHSGEFAERSAREKSVGTAAAWRPKMRTRARNGEPPCNAPVNLLAAGMQGVDKARHMAKGTVNETFGGQMVMFSAARDNEVAWDSDAGGAATGAALRCLAEPGLASAEGSGFISAEALRRCAQARLDHEQSAAERQHVVVHGQTTAPLLPTWADAVTPAPASASNTLEALVQLSDPSWRVLMEPYVGARLREAGRPPFQWATTQRMQIGSRDRLQVTVLSPLPGHLYLVYASRDSNKFELMYPTERETFTLVLQPNVPYTIPLQWPAAGNNGLAEQDTLLAIVSEQPMPELHQFLQGGGQVATAELSSKLAAASSRPCKAATAGTPGCAAAAVDKAFGPAEARVAPMARRFGAARVLVDEF